ncbi:hypothetical protein [Pedobacter aquatilis]|uniref:hypothetical protein n=1 Tax=Pedobacter aquatilis TaxID=351343 RepID=UPI00292D426E|nr:hypothetical protein [Pedobacter aquatilis]
MKFINWKRNWFSSNVELFIDGLQKGAIIFETWKSNANSFFEDQNYYFQNEGFWQTKTNVFDRKTNDLVAVITYDSWKSKALISLKSGEQYEWKAAGMWKTQFTLSNYKDINISYHSNSNTGAIAADADHPLLIVTGLFIKQIYNKRAAVLVACLVPIMVATTSRHH